MARKKTEEDNIGDDLVDSIDKRLGKNAGMLDVTHWLPTGCDLLDWSIGGGLPGGRVVELFGGESAGKSLLALTASKHVIRAGGRAIYLDYEASITPSRCQDLGLPHKDERQFMVRTPDTLELGLDVIEDVALRSLSRDTPTLIVLDSVAASVASEDSIDSKKRLARDEARVAAEARVLNQFCKRGVFRKIKGSQVCLLFINQTRDRIGFGRGEENDKTPGGRSLKFAASVRIRVARYKTMRPAKEGARPAGAFLLTKTVKNKVASPCLTADFPIFFKTGVDNALGLIYFLEQAKAIRVPSSGYVEWEDTKYTRAGLRTEMRGNASLYEAIRQRAREVYFQNEP